MTDVDVAVIGGGIVGLATAYRIATEQPDRTLVVLEKEPELAVHQTGHNSGVIHSGIYYAPGSLKAENCISGRRALVDFCDRESLPYEMCGKVIVAVEEAERDRLRALFDRGRQNGVDCELIDRARLLEIEPECGGIEAIHVRDAGIVDFRAVSIRLAEIVREHGHTVRTSSRVVGVAADGAGSVLETTSGPVRAELIVNCAGLHSDRMARLVGHETDVTIVPFRGEYLELKPEACHLCRHLIYPVPDPSFPFLGAHFTRMIHGGVECGPTAVLAFAREGYRLGIISLSDLAETLRFSGFRRLAGKHWKTGIVEIGHSISKRYYARTLRRLVPRVRSRDLVRAHGGVRAQAMRPDGSMVEDFLIAESERTINVCNAPSPAATSSLNIGSVIATRVASRFRQA